MKKSKPETRAVKRPCVDENEAQAALAKRAPMAKVSVPRTSRMGAIVRNTQNFQNDPLERKPEIPKKVLLKKEQSVIQFGGDKALISVDLADDIDKYLRTIEEEHKIKQDFLSGKQVDWRMRQILVDWLFHVRRRFQLQPETHSLAVYLLDTALFKLNTINKKNLQLYGVACVFIAAKYEEIIVPHIDDFVFVSADAYIRKEILTAEIEILKIVNLELNRPHAIQFLRRFRCLTNAKNDVYLLSRYFCDVSLLVYELIHVKLSIIAASTLYLAFIAYNVPPPSDAFLSTTLLVDASHVNVVARAMVNPAIHFLERDDRLTALREKWKVELQLTNAHVNRMKQFLRSKAH